MASSNLYERSVLFGYLRTVAMFARCTDAQLEQVEALSRFEQRPAGTEIVRQGEGGEDFFVLMTGKASVVRDGNEVGALGPGDFFGELALFDPAPRNATVRADDHVSLVVVTRDAFQDLLGASAELREGVLRGMAHRLHELDTRA